MGLRYVSSESSSLMTAMENNINQVKTSMDSLATGAQQLITAVDGKSLSGAAYTAAAGLFQDCITPAIKNTKTTVDSIQTDLSSYKTQDGTVSGEGILDEDELNQQLTSLKAQKKATENSITSTNNTITNLTEQKNPAYNSYIQQLNSSVSSLNSTLSTINADITEAERKLKLLQDFSSGTSGLFSSAATGLSVAMQSVAALTLTEINPDGTYSLPPGVDKSWFTKGADSFKDSFYFAIANMPKSLTEEEAAQWIADQIKKYGDGVIPFIKTYVGYGKKIQKVIQSVLQIKNGHAYLKGVEIAVDSTGVLRLGNKVLYDPLKGNGTSTKNLFKPANLRKWDGVFKKGREFEQEVGVKFKGLHYARTGNLGQNLKNMGKTGLASLKNSFDFKSKFNVVKNWKGFKDASALGKFGKGLGVVSTVTSLYSNWSANTKNGKTDWVGMGSDVAVDFATGAGATAIGSAVGSFFLPPVGTVVGAGVGMAISTAINWKFGGPPKKSVVDHVKTGVKGVVKGIGKFFGIGG